jgi:hypothetical protein
MALNIANIKPIKTISSINTVNVSDKNEKVLIKYNAILVNPKTIAILSMDLYKGTASEKVHSICENVLLV